MNDCKMDEHFNRILDKLDKHDESLARINETLLRNTISLESHMKRTEQIEKLVIPMHKVYVWGSLSIKILGVLAVVVSIIKYL